MKKSLRKYVETALNLAITGTLFGTLYAKPLENIPVKFAKNVIIMIPDGMSASAFTLTRWVHNDGKPMNMDPLASGLARTHTALNPITDSAPAATAIATGYKTEDKIVGLKPSRIDLEGATPVSIDEAYAPAASVLESAKLNGYLTGLVATSEIMHATPAGFSAHSKSREQYGDISEQQVHQYMNVVFGGGMGYLVPQKNMDEKNTRLRSDNENMIDILKNEGYEIIATRDQLLNLTRDKVWGIFADKDMHYEINRPLQEKVEPSLAEMTQKAIELLDNSAKKSDKGFLLMVEGSKIDWVAHANSIVTQMQEIKAFDDAVKQAVSFAKTNPDTLVIVMTDHANGGLTIGNRITNKNYSSLEKSAFVDVLRNIKFSDWTLAETLKTTPEDHIKTLFQEKMNIELKEDELSLLKSAIKTQHSDPKDNYVINNAVSKIINDRANIAMTTNGHTGEDVPFYVYTANPDFHLTGTVQNSDIPKYIEKALGLDLNTATKALFVPESTLKSQNINVLEKITDPKNTHLKVEVNKEKFTILENKNYVIHEKTGRKLAYNGINVFNEAQFFIPQAAIELMKNLK